MRIKFQTLTVERGGIIELDKVLQDLSGETLTALSISEPTRANLCDLFHVAPPDALTGYLNKYTNRVLRIEIDNGLDLWEIALTEDVLVVG